MSLSASAALTHFPSSLHSRRLSPRLTFADFAFLASFCTRAFLTDRLLCLLPFSGPLRHQRSLFRWRDGASDADSDSSRVHAVGRGFLQRL